MQKFPTLELDRIRVPLITITVGRLYIMRVHVIGPFYFAKYARVKSTGTIKTYIPTNIHITHPVVCNIAYISIRVRRNQARSKIYNFFLKSKLIRVILTTIHIGIDRSPLNVVFRKKQFALPIIWSALFCPCTLDFTLAMYGPGQNYFRFRKNDQGLVYI